MELDTVTDVWSENAEPADPSPLPPQCETQNHENLHLENHGKYYFSVTEIINAV